MGIGERNLGGGFFRPPVPREGLTAVCFLALFVFGEVIFSLCLSRFPSSN